MTFAWPAVLFLLALPLLINLWPARRPGAGSEAAHPHIRRGRLGRQSLRLEPATHQRRPRRRLWLCLGLIFAIVALARPQWGRQSQPLFSQSREILIAIDLSRSMQAQDVAPSRLDRAKLLIDSLLQKLEGERVGLEVFSGTAFLQCPLSADYEILREFLPELSPSFLPALGTNYGAMLQTAMQSFGTDTAADRYLIVLSDGGATDEHWDALLPKLKQAGVRAICLGIGTDGGAMIPDGQGGFVKDASGAVVMSKLDSSTLRELARQTNGVYRDASSWVNLPALLRQTVETGRKGKFTDQRAPLLIERYQWALAPALLCFFISFFGEFSTRPRPRAIRLAHPATAAALAGGLALGLLTLAPPLRAALHESPSANSAAPTPAPLTKLVQSLSAKPHPTGADWAQLARATIEWGQELQSSHQPVTPGPVYDALNAVDRGSQLDSSAADWSALRQQLEDLLHLSKPPPPQKPPPKEQKQEQSSSSQNHQQSGGSSQPSSNPPKPDGSSPPPGAPPSSQNQPSTPQSSTGGGQSTPPPAGGEMGNLNQPPPALSPSSRAMQEITGAEKPADAAQKPGNPALVLPLENLQRVREGDSPARLFQMLNGQTAPAAPGDGKTW